MATQRELIVLALVDAGYAERKRQGRFLAYGFVGAKDWLLLGSGGALRRTSGSIADSHPVSDAVKEGFINRGRELHAAKRRKQA